MPDRSLRMKAGCLWRTPLRTHGCDRRENAQGHPPHSGGIDPVSLALRPDGRELWVANHVSDSVSVIDTNLESRTYLRVVDTVQDFDLRAKATRFDEPVGIAFANNEKAYVALSSENKIAIIDVRSRKVRRHLNITAQDPRAIVVRNGKLYVIPSNLTTRPAFGRVQD